MKIYLAGAVSGGNIKIEDKERYFRGGVFSWKPYVLESFCYVKKEQLEKFLPYFGDFLLDSGAFTFMQQAKNGVDWDDYLNRYAEFINDLDIDKFFELDIDDIVGYQKVLQMRHKLECLTNKKCIPVWHISRGKDEFLKMCDEYPYVSIGGLVGKEAGSKKQKMLEERFPWFISEAHKRGAKIHGLGYTSEKGIRANHFDSVDSTSWTAGNRFGLIYKFVDGKMIKVSKTRGMRCPVEKTRELAKHNFLEWVKFQKWADSNL
ncbi:MAG: hypothetical protein IIY21_28170 [Clostridiales bacterium]|nr:hypothetical protein [Clostridiales bacterium]